MAHALSRQRMGSTKLEGVDASAALKTRRSTTRPPGGDAPFNPTVKDGLATRGLAIPKSNWAQKLDAPPYEAYAVTCGITFTFGGIKISTAAEVVDVMDQPIPGLFAAGEVVGGIFFALAEKAA